MRRRFKPCIETNEVPCEIIHHGHLILMRKHVCQGYVGLIGANSRELAAKPVRRRIREGEVIGECAVGDLVVVIGITPTPKATDSVRIPERAVLEV